MDDEVGGFETHVEAGSTGHTQPGVGQRIVQSRDVFMDLIQVVKEGGDGGVEVFGHVGIGGEGGWPVIVVHGLQRVVCLVVLGTRECKDPVLFLIVGAWGVRGGEVGG